MAGDSIDMTARMYHTENGVAHAEGETYAVTDAVLAETLWAIGFVSIAGWTPPPPEVGSPPTRRTAHTPPPHRPR
jgi:hypothetical protein